MHNMLQIVRAPADPHRHSRRTPSAPAGGRPGPLHRFQWPQAPCCPSVPLRRPGPRTGKVAGDREEGPTCQPPALGCARLRSFCASERLGAPRAAAAGRDRESPHGGKAGLRRQASPAARARPSKGARERWARGPGGDGPGERPAPRQPGGRARSARSRVSPRRRGRRELRPPTAAARAAQPPASSAGCAPQASQTPGASTAPGASGSGRLRRASGAVAAATPGPAHGAASDRALRPPAPSVRRRRSPARLAALLAPAPSLARAALPRGAESGPDHPGGPRPSPAPVGSAPHRAAWSPASRFRPGGGRGGRQRSPPRLRAPPRGAHCAPLDRSEEAGSGAGPWSRRRAGERGAVARARLLTAAGCWCSRAWRRVQLG